MNVFELNQKIASFMGLKDFTIKPNGDILEKGTVMRFNYSANWNELMSVVEKIEKIPFAVTITKHICRIDLGEGKWIIISEDLSKIESVYKAVVNFIGWYNKNILNQ